MSAHLPGSDLSVGTFLLFALGVLIALFVSDAVRFFLRRSRRGLAKAKAGLVEVLVDSGIEVHSLTYGWRGYRVELRRQAGAAGISGEVGASRHGLADGAALLAYAGGVRDGLFMGFAL